MDDRAKETCRTEEQAETGGRRTDNITALFSDMEIKTGFRKFLILICGVEVFIFLACWVYQLGINQFDRFGPVDIPFPWKTYFTVAFLVPVGIVFLLGLFVVAFNRYVYGNGSDRQGEPAGEKGVPRKPSDIVGHMRQVPFLVSLVVLGVFIGITYRIDDIMGFVGRMGEASMKVLLVVAAGGIFVLTIFGLVWMVLRYRLQKKEMEYSYKNNVMRQLGVMVGEDGQIVDPAALLPATGPASPDAPGTSADSAAEAIETVIFEEAPVDGEPRRKGTREKGEADRGISRPVGPPETIEGEFIEATADQGTPAEKGEGSIDGEPVEDGRMTAAESSEETMTPASAESDTERKSGPSAGTGTVAIEGEGTDAESRREITLDTGEKATGPKAAKV